jgi:hypothetical protein
MKLDVWSGLLCLSVASCTVAAPGQNPAQLPAGVYGVYQDNDIGAINQSSWAFGSPQRTFNDPVDAIKAVIAVDYLADELTINPRWVTMSPFAKQEMLQVRVDVRRVLGIAPDAPSQVVVNALLRAAWKIQAGNQDEAIRALDNPAFSMPPPRTLQVLADLPYIRSANIATSDAAAQTPSHGDGQRN